MEASSEKVAVYLHGYEGSEELWYRVEFEADFPITKEDGKLLVREDRKLCEPVMKISLVGSLDQGVIGYGGSWAVIGDYIYWIGGVTFSASSRMYLCEDLLKHNIKHPVTDFWERESSSMNIRRRNPFLTAVGTKKLCVLSGFPWRAVTDYVDIDDYNAAEGPFRSKCGEIYQLESKTWTCLNASQDLIRSYDTSFQATLVLEDDGQEPTQIVFYSLWDGSMLFLDLTRGITTTNAPVEHAYFGDLWEFDLDDKGLILPEGLKLDTNDIGRLIRVVGNVPAVFCNNTFYWFTLDLRLYGYNVEDQIWLRSDPLQEMLTLVDFNPKETLIPILLGLGNKKFVVIVAGKDDGNFAMASFTVARVEDTLTVSVGSVLPFSFDKLSFMPLDGKATLPSRSSDDIMEVAPEASSELVVVCLHGFGESQDLWYRIELPMINEDDSQLLAEKRENEDDSQLLAEKRECRPLLRRPRKKIYPVASLRRDTYGTAGSWDNIGNNIYWIGGCMCAETGIYVCKTLLEHNMNQFDPTHWEIKSSSMNIPRISPFLAALGTEEQLCVLGGTQLCSAGGDNDDRWSKCGEIYDLKNNTWTLLDADYNLVHSYDTFYQASVVEKDGEDPTQIVFYSLADGSTLFLDIPSGTSKGPEKHTHFDMWQATLSQTRSCGVPEYDLVALRDITGVMPAVFTNNTFYWFAHHMRLFGYDILRKRWLHSPVLTSQLPYGVFLQPMDRRPVLVGVGGGKFLLIVSHDPGELMIASFSVQTNEKADEDSDSTDEDYDYRDEDSGSLRVTVNFLQPLYVDDLSFVPVDGKAMLKKAGSSSSMRGSAMES